MNYLLKRASKDALHGNWWPVIGMAILYLVITSVPGYIGPWDGTVSLEWQGLALLLFVLLAPVMIGWDWMMLELARGGAPRVRTMFRPFGDGYLRYVWANLLLTVFTLLWTLLLFVPGIIKGFSYSLTPYLLKDRPELTPLQAITESRRLMDGQKRTAFKLVLSFVGWWLLVMVTLGIAALYVQPYFSATYAQLYLRITEQDENAL